MYLILATIATAVFIYRIYNFYKCPSEWDQLPTFPFFRGLLELFKKPEKLIGLDDAFEKFHHPIMEKYGMARMIDISKGSTLYAMDPDCLKQIMKNTDTFVKNPIADKGETLFREYFGAHQVVSANGEDWKRMRKVMNPIFNQSWKPELFGECFNQTMSEWDKVEGKNILIHDQIQRMTLDVMGKAFFDINFEAVKNSNSELYRLYHYINNEIFKNPLYLVFPIFDHIPYFKRYELHDKVAEYNKFVDNLIQKRKAEIEKRTANKDNLLTQLIQSNIDSETNSATLSDQELRDNLKIFFVAGHDTTANTISATIYYLARYPEIQAKLRSEILSAMGEPGKVRIPTVEELKKMNYLSMVIKEAMRCMTTAAMVDRHCVKPFTFENGIQMPAGKSVTLHLWGLFHNPEYFPEPNKYDPERFRDPNCEANKNWMPFLLGARTCVGMSFSLMEQRVVLAMMIQAYNFEVTQENPDYEKLRLSIWGFPRARDFHVDLVKRSQV